MTKPDDLVDGVDLTLRLGSPFYDWLKQHDEKGKWIPKQDKELMNASPQMAGAFGPRYNVGNIHELQSPDFVEANNVACVGPHDHPILGSNDHLIIKPKPKLAVPKVCGDCRTNYTPLWRKGPNGPQTLCNACGLKYSRLAKEN